MKKIKMLIAAALFGLAVTTLAGCGETTLKPENINGVYSNGERTYVAKYDTDVELDNKEKGYQYHFYADTNKKYNDNVIYSASEFLVNPKDGTIYTLNPLNGSKVKYGQFKDNKMTITKDDTVVSILTGEYKKTKDPVPDQKTLDYNVWSAERDKLQAYKEKTENQPHPSKFEELSNARGWK